MADRTGQQFGNYQLLNLLGQGGFADVYLAEHIHLGTKAAVKVLHTQLTGDDITGFRNEARTIAQLEHPHIVRVLDFGLEGTVPFLVMSYAPNGSLRQLYPRSTVLPLSTVVSHIKQIVEALQYAHDEKIIHRDIKPDNVLLGRHNELLLSDFGIALVAQSTKMQSIQEVIGTVAYMAPEMLQGHPKPASDQYALGIMTYEWLCGDRPFRGAFTELASQHMFVPPPPLRSKNPALSPDVEQVVLMALAKEPSQRFASVKAFAHALEQAEQTQQREPLQALLPPPPAKEEGAYPSDVQKQAVSLSSSPLSAQSPVQVISSSQPSLTSALNTPPFHPTATTSQRRSATDAPAAPVSRIPSLKATPHTQVPPMQYVRQQPANQPTGANSSSAPAQPKQTVSRRTVLIGLGAAGLIVAGAGVIWFTTQQPPIGTTLYTYFTSTGYSDNIFSAVAWSPDGKRITSGGYDETVQVWNAIDGSHAFTYHGHSNYVAAVAWSPDGKRIASGSSDQTVQVWNASNGSNPFTYKGHSGVVYTVAWSPDGKRIASASDETVQVWNATDGSQVFTYKGHSRGALGVAWSPDGKRIASGSADSTVQVWNATDGSHAFTYHGHTKSVLAVAWSPDGKRIASGSADSTVQVWNATDGSNPLTYRGHTKSVLAVAWSPDGKRIASGSADSTVQVWNATDGSDAFTYKGHSDLVLGVAWSPDGKRIASGSADSTVKVWEAV